MGGATVAIIYKIKNTDRVYLDGLMDENTMEVGKMANNMDKEYIKILMEKLKKDSGATVEESNGMKKMMNDNDIIKYILNIEYYISNL